jgi:hypothetical protein
MSALDRILHDCHKYGEDPQTFNHQMVLDAIHELAALRKQHELDSGIIEELGKICVELRTELADVRKQVKSARKVIQAYSDYHEGEYEEMPEQRSGRRWLAAHPEKEARHD